MTTSVGNSQNTDCDIRPDKIISKNVLGPCHPLQLNGYN